ncbi:MAG: alpha/beta hydrolase domain-containing protein [Thermoleophilia bacterium]
MRKSSGIAFDGSWCATKGARLRRAALVAALFLTIAAGLAAPDLAEARITRIQITRVESPTFAGASFGTVGQYEKLVGRAYGEVDPTDSKNAIIADIALAPKNAAGMVEYSTDLFILRPIDRSMGNHRVLYDVNNRGGKFAMLYLNNSPGSFPLPPNDPTTAADAGNGFLMRQGYTLVWSGWDATVSPGNNRLTITVPVAHNPDGSSIVGPALEEFVIDNSTTMTGPLTYAAGSLDKSLASLTVREHYADPPVSIPATNWGYVSSSGNAIRLLPIGTPFQQGRLYEFTYPAKDPLVVGLGFAATRDVAAFLRHAATDDHGNVNPLAGDAQLVYTFCFSLPCRFLRDFVHLGFNEDEQGRPAIDAMLNWVGGGSGGFFNYRFAQPSRTHRQHIGRWYPERQFPFADQVTFDPVTGETDGVLRRCLASGTCPNIFESNSENEYWVKGGSLLHTDTLGNDLPDPENVRFYLFSSLPHANVSGLGICQQPRNPLVPNAGLRALVVALDQWLTAGTEPPASRVPRRGNGTAVPALPQAGVGFPTIPGVTYNGRTSTGDLFDFGSMFGQGILTTLPPLLLGSPYPVFVPTTDADGNDVAGIRLPEIAVPVATYSGWNVRGAAFAGNDLCDAFGQKIDFAQTRAERLAAGDPRLSIEERYANHGTYVSQIARAANRLHKDRLLLDEDVERYVEAAAESNIGK